MKLNSLVFILFSSFFAFGQVTILEENFDSGEIPAGWTIIDNDGYQVAESVAEYTEAWIIKEDPFEEGNFTISSTSYFTPVDRADRWLITPLLTIGAEGNYISWKGLSYDPSFPDSYKVMISTTGNDIEDFTDTLLVVSNEYPIWTSHLEELNEYANQNIYIAFVNTTFDGFKLFLDSIYVREQDPLALNVEAIDYKVYPNPVVEEFYIEVNNAILKNASIYNSLGKQIEDFQINPLDSKIKVNIGTQPSGVYFLRLVTEKGEIVEKILKP